MQRRIRMLFNKNSVTQEPGNKEVQITRSVSLKPVTALINGNILPMEKDWKPEYISPSRDTETRQNDTVTKKRTTTYVAAAEIFPAKWRKPVRSHLESIWQQCITQVRDGMVDGGTWSKTDLNWAHFTLTTRSRRNLRVTCIYTEW